MSRTLGKTVLYVYLTVTALIVVLPIAYVLFGSVRPSPAVTGTLADLIPTGFTFDHIAAAFAQAPLARQFLNSAIVVICQTGLQVVTGILAAYALVFGRLRRPGLILGIYLVTMMVPNEATLIANYLTIRTLGLYDTVAAVFLPFAASAYTIFLLRQTFLSFPHEIREAATIDGAGQLRFLMTILVPLTRPTIMAVSLVSAIAAWNGYLWPLVVTDSPASRTIQVGVASLFSESSTDLGSGLAGLILVAIPTIILVLIGQRFLTRGLTQGAVK